MKNTSRIVAAVAASVMFAAAGAFDAHTALASEIRYFSPTSETQHYRLCHRHNGRHFCEYMTWSYGRTMPRPSTSIPAGSESPRTIFVGDPFWTNTTPGVQAFAMPTSCTPGCLIMQPVDPNGNPQTSNLNVTWSVNGVVTQSDRLSMQDDGNFVFYNLTAGKTWAPPNVRPNGFTAIFQNDGNLVAYNRAGQALWAAGTYNNPNAFLAIQSDGNLVIYKSLATMTALWSSRTYA
jgi:hypothetical protein